MEGRREGGQRWKFFWGDEVGGGSEGGGGVMEMSEGDDLGISPVARLALELTENAGVCESVCCLNRYWTEYFDLNLYLSILCCADSAKVLPQRELDFKQSTMF